MKSQPQNPELTIYQGKFPPYMGSYLFSSPEPKAHHPGKPHV